MKNIVVIIAEGSNTPIKNKNLIGTRKERLLELQLPTAGESVHNDKIPVSLKYFPVTADAWEEGSATLEREGSSQLGYLQIMEVQLSAKLGKPKSSFTREGWVRDMLCMPQL